MTESEPIDVWLRIVNENDDFTPDENGYYNAEANTYAEDRGFRVDWYLSAVGLVTSVRFDTLGDAYAWLERKGFEDYTS